MRTIRTPQPCRNIPGAYELELTRGQVTIFDEEDLPIVTQHTWHADPSGPTFYAVSMKYKAGKYYRLTLHRLLLAAPNGTVVDHIDGNGLNNRRKNIRLCTPQENAMNRTRPQRNPWGYRGVTWNKRYSHFVGQIRHEQKIHYLGSFKTAEEAARAYDEAARRLRGPFARVNFPREGELQG